MSPMGEHFNFHVLVLMCVGNKKLSRLNKDFLGKILKQNADIFTANICMFFSFCVNEYK